jgi:UDP-glucuronate 4-epimerase
VKILVTGTAGFIGMHLCEKLASLGHAVTGIDNINTYYDIDLKYARLCHSGIKRGEIQDGKIVQSGRIANYSFIKTDLADKESLRGLFKMGEFDCVCNLAAQAGVRYSLENPLAYIDSNITGFAHILEGCRQHQVEHLVYASSSSVYGGNTTMPFSVHHNVDHPLSLYAASKKANELMAHTYSHLYDLPTTGLRFFTVYGPWGRPDMALFKFTRAILRDQPLPVFNYGRHRRDFTYIDDIVEGIARVLDRPAPENPDWRGDAPDPGSSKAPWRVYNIGNSRPVELMDYIAALEKALGKKARLDFLPPQPGDVPDTWADVSDLAREFHYQPATSVETGIANFVAWYRSHVLAEGNSAST